MPIAPVLLVHGGAWAMPDDAREAHASGVRNALDAGYALLTKGASAINAVEAALVWARTQYNPDLLLFVPS